MSEAPVGPSTKRQRSPAYPSIGLAEAIRRAGEFWEKEKRHPALITIAARHWGFSSTSSYGSQVAAAMTYYGLMEQSGTGPTRSVKLTDLAIRILGSPEGSPQRNALLKEAVLKPKLHVELLSKWEGELPSDPTVRNYLTYERNFNETSVDDFIRQFRDSLTLAKMDNGGTPSSLDVVEPEADDIEVETQMDTHAGETIKSIKPQLPSGGGIGRHGSSAAPDEPGEVERLRFNLKGGRRVRLMFTGHLPTQADIEKLIANLQLNKDTFPETVEEEQDNLGV